MKRGILIGIFIIAALFIAGCAQQPAQPTDPAGPEQPTEAPAAAEEPLPPVPAEVPVEAPVAETPKEVPVIATPAPAASEEKYTLLVKKGDIVTYKGHRIVIDDIGSGTYILFDVDGYKSKFFQSKTSEIVNGLKVTYEQSFFNTNSSIQISFEPFKLGENEHLLDRKETVKVGNHTLRLDDIKIDTSIQGAVAWFSLENELGDGVRVSPGQTKPINGLKIMLIQTYWRAGNFYAHFKVR